MSRISGPARGSPRDWPPTPPAPHQDGPIPPATDHRRAHHRRAVSAYPRLSGTSRDLRTADVENSCKRAQLQPRTDRSYRTLIRPDGRTDRTPFGDVDRRSVPGRRIGAAISRIVGGLPAPAPDRPHRDARRPRRHRCALGVALLSRTSLQVGHSDLDDRDCERRGCRARDSAGPPGGEARRPRRHRHAVAIDQAVWRTTTFQRLPSGSVK
jgi:hypothetical protein